MSPPAHTRARVDFLEQFATTAERFAVTVASVDMRAPVPTCPGWSTYDLVTHLGNVHAWAATVLETGTFAPEQNDRPSSRKPRTVSQWYAGKAEDLYEVLRSVRPDRPCWNFAFGMGRASFWLRRQLHETTMHAVDLALATGRAPELTAEVGADGVDEALRVFLHRMHLRGSPADLSAPLSVVATDVDRSWSVRPGAAAGLLTRQAPPEVTDGAAALGDRIEGPAAAVYLLLWKRLPVSDPSLSFAGDWTRISAFLASRLTS